MSDSAAAERPWRWSEGYVQWSPVGPDTIDLLIDNSVVATLTREVRHDVTGKPTTPPPEAWERVKKVLNHGSRLVQHAETELGTHIA